MTQIARKPTYSDLDLDFIAHPTTGDVMKKTGEDAIKRSVRNLILTNFYDRPFRSFIGSNVNKILFDNITVFTQKFLEDAVRDVLNNYEPRISISNIEVEVDNENNGFYVTLTFNIINMLEPLTTIIFLERIR